MFSVFCYYLPWLKRILIIVNVYWQWILLRFCREFLLQLVIREGGGVTKTTHLLLPPGALPGSTLVLQMYWWGGTMQITRWVLNKITFATSSRYHLLDFWERIRDQFDTSDCCKILLKSFPRDMMIMIIGYIDINTDNPYHVCDVKDVEDYHGWQAAAQSWQRVGSKRGILALARHVGLVQWDTA